MKDESFYNREAKIYSIKRYPEKAGDFFQYSFLKRLDICLNFINKIVKNRSSLSLLEIGCADGIVLRAINKKFKNFNYFLGMDTSPEMIDAAKALNTDSGKVNFETRDKFIEKKFPIVVEIGVLPLTNIAQEISYVSSLVEKGGYYLCSYGSKSSLYHRLKNDIFGSKDLSYSEFEGILKEYFFILEKKEFGLFFPKLWFCPPLGRFFQPMADFIFSFVLPDLFHEKIYLLKKK